MVQVSVEVSRLVCPNCKFFIAAHCRCLGIVDIFVGSESSPCEQLPVIEVPLPSSVSSSHVNDRSDLIRPNPPNPPLLT